jgi:hypothetical protein
MANRNGSSPTPCCMLAYRRVPLMYPEPRSAILPFLCLSTQRPAPLFLLPALRQSEGSLEGPAVLGLRPFADVAP